MMMLFSSKKQSTLSAAKKLYGQIMEQSRQPYFYLDCQVPDTLEGRFEILTLHTALLVNRLSQPDMGREGCLLAQTLFDVMFRNLDWSLREMGVGDLGVPRRIKKMMSSFKGRAFAYEESLKSGSGEIKHALIRNVYEGKLGSEGEALAKLSTYLQDYAHQLSSLGLSDFSMGKVAFPVISQIKDSKVYDVKQAA